MPIDLSSLVPSPHKKHLETIDAALKKAGFECYLVGGSVRDLVMKKIPKEYDLTTNAEPKDVKKLFRTVIDTGIEHGTVTVVLDKVNYEITTYRIDKDYVDGRRPGHVEFGTTLHEDLKRRDFTMNALAYDLKSCELIDEHDGLVDIENKIIRTIGNPIERFTEDGLRPIRALRFASTLNFKIEPETKKAIQLTKHITKKISLERFQDEILKSFLGENPSAMIRLLAEENLFQVFLPTLPNDLTPNEIILDKLNYIPKELVGMQLCFAFYSISPDISLKELETYLRSLKFSGQNIKDTLLFFEILQKWIQNSDKSSLSIYDIKKNYLAPVKRHFNSRYTLDETFFQKLKPIFEDEISRFVSIWNDNPPLLLSDLALNGNHLSENFPNLPKTKFGEVLHLLLELVLHSPKENEFHKLIAQSAEIINNLSK
ncbi:CCA tRNA nucleotidyltransferase [Leptospira bouyouniensis]|uniref:CCA tRNA nucleotidyltransferase n=1 Tax=Leptospira bouyouniensis TaxID=2484911 RepID=A0A7I0HW59_9LEPT|nr:CCA tRNA nucleotidyltransferase [Leptospira bouyouniensis]TGL08581.1 CCA tRNA nucleotidyltransferase [Leptospira bouyouniensis]